jgi:lipopolysaccharide heptosyltransferase II
MRARAFHPESVDSILVMRLYFVGDVLLSTPVFEALKGAFPRANLTLLLKRRALEVVERNPFVDNVVVYDGVSNYHSPAWLASLAGRLRKARYGLCVDLTGDLRSSWLLLASDPGFRIGFNHAGCGFLLDRRTPYRSEGHVVDHLVGTVSPVGATLQGPVPRLYLTDRERRSAIRMVHERGIEEDAGYVVVSPGANWEFRRWPAVRFGHLAAMVRDRLGLRSVIVGSADDAGLANEVLTASDGAATSIAGATSLRDLAAVSAAASAFVGNDSGPMHLAASQGTPVVALFGPNTPERFAPRGCPSRVLWARFDCSPCSQRRCLRPHNPCMDAISVEEAFDALVSLLDESPQPEVSEGA